MPSKQTVTGSNPVAITKNGKPNAMHWAFFIRSFHSLKAPSFQAEK